MSADHYRMRAGEMRERYNPMPGIHVCGIDQEGEEFFTQANFPGASREQFLRAKAELASDGDHHDFIVDLVGVNGDIAEDFPINRQMLDRLTVMLNPA